MKNNSALRFWLLWFVGGTVGFLAGAMIAFPLGWTMGDYIAMEVNEALGFLTVGLIFGSLMGGGLGAGQWLALRRHGFDAAGWPVAGAITGAVGMALGMLAVYATVGLGPTTPDERAGAVMGAVLGLAIGLGQWSVLRHELRGAGVWPLISLVAGAAALAVALPLGGEGREWISLGVAGLLIASLSGAGMLLLIGQAHPAPAAQN
jgi:hypothetical protein